MKKNEFIEYVMFTIAFVGSVVIMGVMAKIM